MPSELSIALYGVVPTVIVVLLSHYLKRKFSEQEREYKKKSDDLKDVGSVIDIYIMGMSEQRKEIAELKENIAILRKDFEDCSKKMTEHLKNSK